MEDVSGVDAVVLGYLQELGDLLHLLEGHGGGLDLLHWGLPLRVQPINELTQHRAILEPVLEVLEPMLGPAHMLAALDGDLLDQNLLQVRIVLFLSLLLNLPAQAVGRSPVGHSEGWQQWLWGRFMWVGELRTRGGGHSMSLNLFFQKYLFLAVLGLSCGALALCCGM